MSTSPRWLQRWWAPVALSLMVNGTLLGMLVRLSAMPTPPDEMSVVVALRMPEREAVAPDSRRPLVREMARSAPVRTPVSPVRKPVPKGEPVVVQRAPPLARPALPVVDPAQAVQRQPEAAPGLPAGPVAQIALTSLDGEGQGGAPAATAMPGAGEGPLGNGSGTSLGSDAGDPQGVAGLPGTASDGGPAVNEGVGKSALVGARGQSRGPDVVGQSRPVYPPDARSEGIQGTAVLRVRLDAAGKVTNVGIEHGSGDRRLDAAAERAVRHWTYRPRLKDGDPVESSLRVRVEFRLE